jgi:hypothetical protein
LCERGPKNRISGRRRKERWSRRFPAIGLRVLASKSQQRRCGFVQHQGHDQKTASHPNLAGTAATLLATAPLPTKWRVAVVGTIGNWHLTAVGSLQVTPLSNGKVVSTSSSDTDRCPSFGTSCGDQIRNA